MLCVDGGVGEGISSTNLLVYESLSYGILMLERFVLLAVRRDLLLVVKIYFTRIYFLLFRFMSHCANISSILCQSVLTSTCQQIRVLTDKLSLNIQINVLGHMP